MSNTISNLRDIPAHLWLLVLFLALMVAYYIRPDNVTEDLLKSVVGAYLLSLRATPVNTQDKPK